MRCFNLKGRLIIGARIAGAGVNKAVEMFEVLHASVSVLLYSLRYISIELDGKGETNGN